MGNRLSHLFPFLNRYSLHIRNILYFLGTRLVSIVAFLFVVPFFIRNTSEEQYGLAAIGLSLLAISTALDVALGYVLTQILGRRYARNRSLHSGATVGLFTLYFYLAIGIAVLGLVVVIALGLPFQEAIMYGSFFTLLPALCVSGVVASIFQARNQLKPINLSRFGFEISKAAALVLSAKITNDVLLVGPVLVVTAYCRALLDIRCLAKSTGIEIRCAGFSDSMRFWKLAKHGMASFYVVGLTAIVTIGDKLMIKYVINAGAVAHYSVAFDINSKAYLLVNAVNTAMFAVLLHRSARKMSLSGPLMVGLGTVSLVALLYYIPLLVLAPIVLSVWVSAEFANDAAPLARIMAFSSLLYLFGNVFENALNAMGRAQRVLKIYISAIVTYGITIGWAIWHQSVRGFMFSYLAMCAVLFLGFLLQYYLATRSLGASGVKNAGP